MSKIIIKPAGEANCHDVYLDGKRVGEFRFIRDRVYTRPQPGMERRMDIATAGKLIDLTTSTVHDLGCFAWFTDVKRHVTAHFEGHRLPTIAKGTPA